MTNNSVTQMSFPYVYGMNVEHEYPQVSMSIERITPEVAEKMLAANISNRDINEFSIVMKALQDGEWELNGATIVFDEHGILRDGQHRLNACVKSGKPIETIVARGIPGKSQITMDTGTKRALRDYTKMKGYPNYSIVATVGLGMYIADTYGTKIYFTSQRGGRATFKAVINFIDNNYEQRIKPLITDIRETQARYKHINAGLLAVLFDLFRSAGHDNYKEFVGQLLNKRPQCVSVRLLQEALLKNSNEAIRTKRLTDKYLAAYVIKTWNAYMRGDDIKQLKFTQGGAHPESFPEIFLSYE